MPNENIDINVFDNLAEDFKIKGTLYSISDYLHGRCNNFAIILSDLSGLKAGGLFHVDIDQDHEPLCLNHAYCILNEKYIVDAAGIRLLNDVKDEYGHCDRYDYEMYDCLDLLKKETKLGNYNAFNDSFNCCERLKLKEHIKKYLMPLIRDFGWLII